MQNPKTLNVAFHTFNKIQEDGCKILRQAKIKKGPRIVLRQNHSLANLIYICWPRKESRDLCQNKIPQLKLVL